MKLHEVANIQPDHSKIKQWLDRMEIKNYSIRTDGIIDVTGYVDLRDKNLHEIPVQFGYVYGNFRCTGNYLTSLKGSPHYVSEIFDVGSNELTSLQYCPIYVGETFCCYQNKKCFDILKYIFNPKVKIGKFQAPPETATWPEVDIDNIINKYLPSKDLMNCVEEMLEAGYVDYTKGLKP